MTEVEDTTSSLWNDRYLAYIPLLGAAVALTYDVGCFYAIQISLFTLFSLSEHIVFAIQAFPLALVVLIVGSMFAPILGKKPPPPYNPGNVSNTRRIIAYLVLGLLLLAAIALVGLMLFSNPIAILPVIEIVIAAIGAALIVAPYKRVFIASMAVLIVLTLSFLVGYLSGTSYLSNDDTNKVFAHSVETVNFKNGGSISGRIIRSGERGVLLYDVVSNRIRFELWDAIRSIEAIPLKTTLGR